MRYPISQPRSFAIFSDLDRTIIIARSNEHLNQQITDFPAIHSDRVAWTTDHAKKEDVEGRHVFGVIPMNLEAETESVTRYDIRPDQDQRAMRDAANNTYSAAQVDSMSQGLVTYSVAEVYTTPEEVRELNPLYVTRHNAEIENWRQQGLIEPNTHVVVVCDQPAEAEKLAQESPVDNASYTTRADLDDLTFQPPPDAAIVYTHIPEDSVAMLDGQHAVGNLPPHLRERTETVTNCAYDPQTRGYSPAHTYRTEVIMRTATHDPALE